MLVVVVGLALVAALFHYLASTTPQLSDGVCTIVCPTNEVVYTETVTPPAQ